MKNKQAFTLIELLVVVLIIGILAAVALPQYQKAVWKSRATQLFTSVRSLAMAQEAHYMATGEYATSFGELDLDFSSLESGASSGPSVESGDAARKNDFMQLIINRAGNQFIFSRGVFLSGPYKLGSLIRVHYDSGSLENKMYCAESKASAAETNRFCAKMYNATVLVATQYGNHYYEMP